MIGTNTRIPLFKLVGILMILGSVIWVASIDWEIAVALWVAVVGSNVLNSAQRAKWLATIIDHVDGTTVR